ncbi:PhzF family phenazine biosynthesis protein [Porticoccaceae bacterium]|nr:PhzF family phenazine biosynthesis protein [Porticoccaceae bacterium]
MKTFIVDSFTDEAFKGNPAGVCLLKTPMSDEVMLKIAQELGLSETAFVSPIEDSKALSIRYFSPKMEIPLCGHATLASAKVVFEATNNTYIEFINIQNITLPIESVNGQISMRFPVYETAPANAPEALLAALGLKAVINSVYNDETKILLLEIESSEKLSRLSPDYESLYKSHHSINGVLVTAKSCGEFDFHSRYFWPWSGTNEDPVTGGTHTFLAKYWSERLGKKKMKSFQSSARSGFMGVEIDNDQLIITGSAVVIFRGELFV